jgi:hypothetical protein
MLEMHPSELKNIALTAAAAAERDGFTGTAEAWAQIARICALEANSLVRDDLDDFILAPANFTMKTVAA